MLHDSLKNIDLDCEIQLEPLHNSSYKGFIHQESTSSSHVEAHDLGLKRMVTHSQLVRFQVPKDPPSGTAADHTCE